MIRIILFLIFFVTVSQAQLIPRELSVAPQFQSHYDSARTLNLPKGFSINVFYVGALERPRYMAFDESGVLYVADMGAKHIFALPDKNGDGIADTIISATPIVDSAHSLVFYHQAMYVAEPTRIRKFRDTNHDGYFETEDSFIVNIPSRGPYDHYTRTIVLDSINKYFYVNVGASCNACRETDSERATILRYNLDGTGKLIIASGLRNALGLAIEPTTNALWTTNADRDNLGDDIPPEIITKIDSGHFYGWPYAYGGGVFVNPTSDPEYQNLLPFTAIDSAKVATMNEPKITIEAHSTPMSILFVRNNNFHNSILLDGLIAIHGSAKGGRTVGVGYKVISIHQKDVISDQWEAQDFLTGFLTDSILYKFWGRPCGLAKDVSDVIYLSCDAGIPAIYRITFDPTEVVRKDEYSNEELIITPNPVENILTIQASSNTLPNAEFIHIYNILGCEVFKQRLSSEQTRLDLSLFPKGEYFVIYKSGTTKFWKR